MQQINSNETRYMTADAVMPFCKGCGHTHILKKLNEALHKLKLDPKDVCLVTDIGCIGLADSLFDNVHTVHTTHGRSTAFATGIAVADKVLADKKLKIIVLIGDGGSMIGLLHIINAALLNTDITVLVANNFLFGMTGGQQSSFSPLEFVTQTTPYGNIIPPLDICSVSIASKAEFAARKIASDKDLTDTIADAISHDGFSIVEILELCTEHAVTKNSLKGSSLSEIALEHNHQLGQIKKDNSRLEFGKNLARIISSYKSKEEIFIYPENNYSLQAQTGIIIAGSAGEKVQSSAAMLCSCAVQTGLNATQKNDNPVTQGSGFSSSEVILSPAEIFYIGIDSPSVVIIVSNDGLKELKSQKMIEKINSKTLLIVDEEVSEFSSDGKKIVLPLRKSCTPAKAALGAVNYYIKKYSPFPHEIFKSALEKKHGEYYSIFKKDYYYLLE